MIKKVKLVRMDDLQAQIKVTQPSMGLSEHQQFLSWLQQQSQDDQWAILAYQWKYMP